MTQVSGKIVDARAAPGARASPAARFITLVTSHAVIDIFPILFTALLWPLQARLGLQPWQVTVLIMATPIFSGALQPMAAWLTDKHDTRLFGPLGLALGGICIGSIGFAQNFWQLVALQVVGVIATGAYHPIATALAGQSGSRLLRNGRAQAIGIFICAGMVGHTLGAEFGPIINERLGMEHLAWLIPPALIVALLLHVLLRHVRHRHDNHHELHASFSLGERRLRWRTVGVLAFQNALRFIVNIALLAVMFNVWAKSKVLAAAAASGGVAPETLLDDRAVAASSSIQVGHLSVALTVGMGVGVLLAGRFARPGSERRYLIALSLLGAVFTVLLGPLGDAVHAAAGFGLLSMLPVYVCVSLTAMGFFATFPIATSLAQRLQPGHTGLVTSLLMGAGWAIGSLSAPLAMLFFGFTSISAAPLLEPWRINMGFVGFAALLVVAALSTLLIPRELVERAAADH